MKSQYPWRSLEIGQGGRDSRPFPGSPRMAREEQWGGCEVEEPAFYCGCTLG